MSTVRTGLTEPGILRCLFILRAVNGRMKVNNNNKKTKGAIIVLISAQGRACKMEKL